MLSVYVPVTVLPVDARFEKYAAINSNWALSSYTMSTFCCNNP